MMKYELIVAGGGMSGVAAAGLAAAQAIKKKTVPSEIDVKELQSDLKDNGVETI